MVYSEKPRKPFKANMHYIEDGKFVDHPTGCIRIDPLDVNYLKYKDIATKIGARNNKDDKGLTLHPLWFVLLDHEYGIQNNIKHEYQEVRPYMRSEPFKYYSGSDSEHIEFMVRFFAVTDPIADVHASYEYLMALQYPWTDTDTNYKYPPPRLIVSFNGSLNRVGYITASNLTWYNPVGIAKDLVITGQNKYGDWEIPSYFTVAFYLEALLTFTVVGNQYNSTDFNNIHSANKFLANLKNFLTAKA